MKKKNASQSANFRYDVDANRLVDGDDVSFVQSKTRTSLP
jgi:hypothetical protein